MANGKQDIVLITHGIFSQGQWFDLLKNSIEQNGVLAKGLRYPTVYFFQFWMPEWIGRWIIPWFSRERALERLLLQILAFPQDTYRVSIVAHSFGTWLIANILRRYPAVKLHRIVFLGCIVPDNFPWQDVIPRNVAQDSILNVYGTKDILPLLANAITWGYGPTGTFGFGQAFINDYCKNTGHSELLTADFTAQVVAPFLIGKPLPGPDAREDYRRIRILDFAQYLKYLLLILALWFTMPKLASLVYANVLMPSSQAPATLRPKVQSWDKLVDQIKPGDDAARKLIVHLDKWKSYLAKGAQPWLFTNSNEDSKSESTTTALGWFEIVISSNRIQTFSYAVETISPDIEVIEIYAFLTHNENPDGYLPAYRQMQPTIGKNIADIEISGLIANDKLLCFVLVKSASGTLPPNPNSWGITLRRK